MSLLENNPHIYSNNDGTFTVTGPTNSPTLPEIYQIEIHERCNFSCDFCQTGQWFQGKSKQNASIDLYLIQKIIERDLGGSYFVELQHRGEPLLNNQLGDIISLLKPHVFVGLSTNGSLINRKLEECLMLDYMTISVDAANKELYEQLRKGGNWEKLLDNIDLLIKARGDNPTPIIDLQLIQLHETECEDTALKRICEDRGWDVRVRTIQDCFLAVNHPSLFKVKTNDLCLNPFMSVSVHSDGNVVPCCRVWKDEWIYGNLWKNSLYEIWHDNPKVEEFRKMHRENKGLPFFCETCYSRSPVTLHWDIYRNAMNNLMRRQKMFRDIQLKIKSAQGD